MFCRCGSVEPAQSKICSKCGAQLIGAKPGRGAGTAHHIRRMLAWTLVFALGLTIGFVGLHFWHGGQANNNSAAGELNSGDLSGSTNRPWELLEQFTAEPPE